MLRAQLPYIDLPQVRTIKSSTNSPVANPWFRVQPEKTRCLRRNAHIDRLPAIFPLPSSHKVAIAVKQ